MPYSGADDTKLPANVKKASPKERRQWIHVFNSELAAHPDDEARAFASANSVLNSTKEAAGLLTKAFSLIRKSVQKTVLYDLGDEPADDDRRFKTWRMKDGSLRWFTVVTNVFRDREKEILSSKAHIAFVDSATRSQQYPELWLWHAGPASKWGQTDFLDFVEGFVVASGTVDKDKEWIADRLDEDAGDIYVSHGFFPIVENKATGVTDAYWMFEISPLPAFAAANEWTLYMGASMGFDPTKRKWLLDKGFSSDDVDSFEASLKLLGKTTKEQGVDFKEVAEPAPFDLMRAAVGEPETKADGSIIHHPHAGMQEHFHSHMGGDYHTHGHSHGDGSHDHDTDEHESSYMSSMKGSKEVGIVHWSTKAVTNANKTKPEEYSDVADDDFLDAKNYKYPVDSKHLKAAEGYFNHKGQREKGGYSGDQWAAMGGKLASKLGDGYSYDSATETVVKKDKALDTETTDEKAAHGVFKRSDGSNGPSGKPGDNDPDDTGGASDDDADDDPPAKKKPKDVGTSINANNKKNDENADDGQNVKELLAVVKAQNEQIVGLVAQVKGLGDSVAALKKSDDERIVGYFRSEAETARQQTGYIPTEAKDNVVRRKKENDDAFDFAATALGGLTIPGRGA